MARQKKWQSYITQVNLNRYGALGITLLYAFVGCIWILLSDQLFLYLTSSLQDLSLAQTAKGLLYVAVTAVILFILIRKLQKIQFQLAESAMRSELLYRDIFTASPEAQLIYDPESLQILDANEQACRLFDLKLEVDSKINLRQIFRESLDTNKFLDWLVNSTCNDSQDDQYFKLCTKAREEMAQLSIMQHKVLKDGQFIGYLLVKDVSEVRRFIRNIEHAVKRLDIAREVSGMGCWEIDLNNKQILCCQNVTELLDIKIPANTAVPLERFERDSNTSLFCDITEEMTKKNEQDEIRQEHCIRDKDQKVHYILVDAQYFEQNEHRSIVGTLIDQTSQKEIESRLLQQQEQWNNLVETLPDGVAIIQNNNVSYANKAVLQMFHADKLADLQAQSIEHFIDDKSKTSVRQRMSDILNKREDSGGFHHRHLLRLDGKPFECEIASKLISYQGKDAIQIVIRDLTDRVKTESELAAANQRLSILSSTTLDMLERERKRIAGELHDDVGQSLTAIKLGIRWLTRRLTDDKLIKKAEDIQSICTDTLETVRSLSLMLRPAQLDSLGLSAAIEWQAEKLFTDSAIAFNLDVSEFTEMTDKDQEITVFRVIQESLTNIIRHANASAVTVKLISEANKFSFMVIDDGMGFDINQHTESTGLVNMKERVELAGGQIQVRSLPGVGTEIKVSLPVKTNAEIEVE
ncbi:sensor histidine kinase [Catenovulum sediminis]|uniref:histidine kinase n=1 Tax=Catenovulum sediminis TaxID=1740262 RepID=A0ABV1RMX3_9ALTE